MRFSSRLFSWYSRLGERTSKAPTFQQKCQRQRSGKQQFKSSNQHYQQQNQRANFASEPSPIATSGWSWSRRLLFGSIPFMFLQTDEEQVQENSARKTRDSVFHDPMSPKQKDDVTGLKGTAHLVISLKMGTFSNSINPGGFADSGLLKTLGSVRSMPKSASNSTAGDQISKRKFFQNLQDMFNLQPEPSVSDEGKANTPAGTTRKQDINEKEKHVFERLVVGDKLVLTEGDITKDQWKALSAFLASCPHIRSLRLQGMEISARDADELGKGLNQIRNITFCDNSIGLHEGSLERLVALLLCCGLLESTSIVRNSLGDAHIPHLVSLIKHHSRLARLSLSWNGITDTGASQIASAIAVLDTSIRDIDLSYNSIGAEGQARLHDATRKRMERFGQHVAPLHVQFRHNESFHDFRREFKENSDSFLQHDPPWYIRRSFLNKENMYPKPLKKLRK